MSSVLVDRRRCSFFGSLGIYMTTGREAVCILLAVMGDDELVLDSAWPLPLVVSVVVLIVLIGR